MAEFDAQTILDAVDAGTAPDTWKIYRARKSYLLGQGLFLFIVGLLMLLCSAGLCAMGVFILFIPQRDIGAILSAVASIFVGVGCIALSVAILRAGASLWWQMRAAATQVFVLTPDGFIARTSVQPKIPLTDSAITPPAIGWTGTKAMRIYTVAYSEVRAVALVVRHTRADTQISLDLTLKTPNPCAKGRWLVDPRFGASESIAQSIIEAYSRYTAQHPPTQ